jgi:hypothetical protein
MSPTLYQEEEEEEVEEEEWLRLTYLVTLPLCTGVSRMVWVSRAGDINLPHDLPRTEIFFTFFSRSAISVNRREVSYQFLLSFSRLRSGIRN